MAFCFQTKFLTYQYKKLCCSVHFWYEYETPLILLYFPKHFTIFGLVIPAKTCYCKYKLSTPINLKSLHKSISLLTLRNVMY